MEECGTNLLATSIKTVNGVAVVDMETPLDKASLKHGDKVTLEFDGKCYSGEIDLEHSSPPESPRKKQQVSPKSDPGACPVEDPSAHPEEVHSATRKRKHPPTAASFSEQKKQRKFVEKKAGRLLKSGGNIQAEAGTSGESLQPEETSSAVLLQMGAAGESTLLSGFIKYVMDTMVRIEGKVDSNEEKLEVLIRDKETLYRSLEMVRQKQEMVLTKQDQLHFTLHGETTPRDTSPMYTTPPLTSPTLPFRRSVTPMQPISEVASSVRNL